MAQFKLNDEIEIVINREEANFDRACDSARCDALNRFGVDESGHITNVAGADRSDSEIVIQFVDYHMGGGVQWWTHYYRFKAWVTDHEL